MSPSSNLITVYIDHNKLRQVVDPRRKELGIREPRTDDQGLLVVQNIFSGSEFREKAFFI